MAQQQEQKAYESMISLFYTKVFGFLNPSIIEELDQTFNETDTDFDTHCVTQEGWESIEKVYEVVKLIKGMSISRREQFIRNVPFRLLKNFVRNELKQLEDKKKLEKNIENNSMDQEMNIIWYLPYKKEDIQLTTTRIIRSLIRESSLTRKNRLIIKSIFGDINVDVFLQFNEFSKIPQIRHQISTTIETSEKITNNKADIITKISDFISEIKNQFCDVKKINLLREEYEEDMKKNNNDIQSKVKNVELKKEKIKKEKLKLERREPLPNILPKATLVQNKNNIDESFLSISIPRVEQAGNIEMDLLVADELEPGSIPMDINLNFLVSDKLQSKEVENDLELIF
jgi:hypothetical protein